MAEGPAARGQRESAASRGVRTDPEVRAEAEIRLWGETVGAVVELEGGRVIFEYAADFRRRGLEISPLRLPTSVSGPRTFPELRREPSFLGLPGVLADSLPDAFGNQVIRAYFAARGEPQRALSPVQRLLYVGERALGALTYHPAERLSPRPAEQESLDLFELVRDARKIVQGEPDVTIPEIYRIGSSAGGRRPKAVILHNPLQGAIRSGNAIPEPGDVPCILKFDGVGESDSEDALGDPLPYNRIEAAYGKMAREAGVITSDVSVLESGGHAHLLVRRFDVEGDVRIHQHSFGGLIHVDYNDPGASSYEEYLRTILQLGMPPLDVEQGYRRMVFNIMAVNQDDHVKNLSFHMRPDGVWSLTPAYDLTFAQGTGWTSTHQMRVQDKLRGITDADLFAVARQFGLKRPERIFEQTRDALSHWERWASEFAVPPDAVRHVRGALDRRASALHGVTGSG